MLGKVLELPTLCECAAGNSCLCVSPQFLLPPLPLAALTRLLLPPQGEQQGVLVRRVEPTAPAGAALQQWDILMAFDGKTPESTCTFFQTYYAHKPLLVINAETVADTATLPSVGSQREGQAQNTHRRPYHDVNSQISGSNSVLVPSAICLPMSHVLCCHGVLHCGSQRLAMPGLAVLCRAVCRRCCHCV